MGDTAKIFTREAGRSSLKFFSFFSINFFRFSLVNFMPARVAKNPETLVNTNVIPIERSLINTSIASNPFSGLNNGAPK
jgi:hypothetical protein